MRIYLCLALLLGACSHSQKTVPSKAPAAFIDLHAHLCFSEAEAKAFSSARSCFHQDFWAQSGLNKAEKVGAIVIAQPGNMEQTKKQNDQLLAFAAKHQQVIPIASVHPADGEASIQEMRRLKDLGVRIIKLHPNTQRFDVASAEVAALVAEAGRLKLILLFDSWSPFDADQTGKFLLLAAKNPQTKFILAHMGGAQFLQNLVFHVAQKYPWFANNVWFDLSAISHLFVDSPYQEQMVWVARKLGTERLIYGSDFPVVSASEAQEDMLRLGFTTEELQRIMYLNAQELLQKSP